jgi:hypothetical protein
MSVRLADETFQKAIAEAYKAGRESGVFDLEMALLGMIPNEGDAVAITNVGNIAHVYVREGQIRLDALIDNR